MVMLVKVLFNNESNIKKDVTNLLVTAFPKKERPPVDYFFMSLKRKENTLIAYYEKDIFIGFSYITIYKDICYIFFLAVKKEYRQKGYGTEIIEYLKEAYQDKVLLLCYEEVDQKYDDYNNRLKREDFYKKRGFKDNNLKTNEYGAIFQTAYIGKRKVSFLEYQEIFKLGFGKGSEKYLKEEK
jgi:ribosomal protein S18 acetylase RimI-like enzyme